MSAVAALLTKVNTIKLISPDLHAQAGNSYESDKQFQSFLMIPVMPATKRPVNNQPKICCARK